MINHFNGKMNIQQQVASVFDILQNGGVDLKQMLAEAKSNFEKKYCKR